MCVRALSHPFAGVDVGEVRPVADLGGEQRPGGLAEAPACPERSLHQIGTGLCSGHYLWNGGTMIYACMYVCMIVCGRIRTISIFCICLYVQ